MDLPEFIILIDETMDEINLNYNRERIDKIFCFKNFDNAQNCLNWIESVLILNKLIGE